jgi:hypothetical protein
MTRVIALAMAATVALGCENKKTGASGDGGAAAVTAAGGDAGAKPAATVEPAKPKFADTTPLWALAPADASLGVVIADGAGSSVLNQWTAQLKKLQGKSFAKKTNEQIDAMRKQMPFDIFDESAYRTKGFDLSKGMALFATPDLEKPALVVIPVGDLAAFRKTVGATTEKVGEREIDKMEDAVCATVSGRYACAPTIEQVDAALKPHDSPLAGAVKALPAESRGDIEFYADASKMPKLKEGLAELKPFGDFNTLGAALRFSKTDVNLVGWGKGTMGPIGLMLASAAPPSDLAGLAGNAVTVVRVKVDPKLLALTGEQPIPLPDGDKILLSDLLTGDLQVVTAGKGLLAGAVLLKVTDAAKVKKALSAICAEAKKAGDQLPISNLVAKEDSCGGEVSLAALKDAIGLELPPFKINLALTGNVLAIVLGDVDLGALKGTVTDEAGSPEAKEILGGPQTVSFWSRDLGIDATALPKDLTAKLATQPEIADALGMMGWWGAQTYDAAIGLNVSSNGFKLLAHGTTFESDPAEARAALEAAYDKRMAGDRPGYLAALADIEKKLPGTLASRRARAERLGAPVLGPVAGVLAGAGAGAAYFLGHVTATGGFGEPGGHPAPATGGEAEKPAEEKPAGKP